MNPTLAALIAALGLATTATEAEALSAVGALRTELATLKTKPPLPAALVTELGLAAGADEAAALTAVKGLKGADTGAVAAVTLLQGQVAALTARLNEDNVVKLVDTAIADEKITPALRDFWVGQGRKDLAALTAYVASAPKIPGLSGQSGGRTAAEETAALTADAAKVKSAFGLTDDQWAKGTTAKA